MAATRKPTPEALVIFRSKEEWAQWLELNHGESTGLWLQIAKKDSQSPSITYKDALDVALCYGWIDGQKRPLSQEILLQRFLPRASQSLWSKINREKALASIASGEMRPAGCKAIEDAKRSGRWDAAYDSPRAAVLPSDLQDALDASPQAKSFFATLDKANRCAILWRIQTAKKRRLDASASGLPLGTC